MNADFFLRRGENWDRIIRGNKVDFIILDLSKSLLKRDDLEKLGFGIVWWDGSSALFARKDMAQKLCDFNRGLPYRETPTLDARIPDSWWKS
jgi:hypothetical protein